MSLWDAPHYGNEYVMRALDADGQFVLGCHILNDLLPTNTNKVWAYYCGMLVLQGEGRYVDWDGMTHELRPGMFAQHYPDRWHSIHRTEGWVECSLTLSPAMTRHWMALGLLPKPVAAFAIPSYRKLIPRFAALQERLRTLPASSLYLAQADMVALIADIRRLGEPGGATSQTDRMALARARLGTDFSREVDLEQLAASLGWSYSHFRREFAEATGQSPNQFRLAERMAQARLLVGEGQQTLASIAAMLGYNDAFAFSRQFKRFFGESPAAFRTKHQA